MCWQHVEDNTVVDLRSWGLLQYQDGKFKSCWKPSVILMEILGDKECVIKDSFLLDASITRKEILALLPPFDPTGLPSKYSHSITDREQEQAGTREKDSLSLVLLLKKLYHCWNCSLKEPILVLGNLLKVFTEIIPLNVFHKSSKSKPQCREI